MSPVGTAPTAWPKSAAFHMSRPSRDRDPDTGRCRTGPWYLRQNIPYPPRIRTCRWTSGPDPQAPFLSRCPGHRKKAAGLRKKLIIGRPRINQSVSGYTEIIYRKQVRGHFLHAVLPCFPFFKNKQGPAETGYEIGSVFPVRQFFQNVVVLIFRSLFLILRPVQIHHRGKGIAAF